MPLELPPHSFLDGLGDLAFLREALIHVEYPSGAYLWRQGDRADCLFLVESGKVGFEILIPNHAPARFEIVGPGEVMGWMWDDPTHRWQFDARALEHVTGWKCPAPAMKKLNEQDPALGYELLRRFALVLAKRLQASRLRLLKQLQPLPGEIGDDPEAGLA